jgi:hypothetical protein
MGRTMFFRCPAQEFCSNFSFTNHKDEDLWDARPKQLQATSLRYGRLIMI